MEREHRRRALEPCHGVYATDFQNGNFYETSRPASAKDKSALDKVVLNLRSLRDHFRQRIAIKQACHVKPSIAYLMKDAAPRPSERPQGVTARPAERIQSGDGARPEVEIRRDQARRDSDGSAGARRAAGEGVGARGGSERPTQRRRHANRPNDYVAPDSKLLGMFAAKNPALAHLLLPQNSDACTDFCFKRRE